VSIRIVTGPSFTSETCMSAPNTPVAGLFNTEQDHESPTDGAGRLTVCHHPGLLYSLYDGPHETEKRIT